jgi:hypothetical protein
MMKPSLIILLSEACSRRITIQRELHTDTGVYLVLNYK